MNVTSTFGTYIRNAAPTVEQAAFGGVAMAFTSMALYKTADAVAKESSLPMRVFTAFGGALLVSNPLFLVSQASRAQEAVTWGIAGGIGLTATVAIARKMLNI